MKTYSLIGILVCFNILFGCGSQQSSTQQERSTASELRLYFFSDEEQATKEISYYRALLDVKRNYPGIVNKMKVYSQQDKPMFREYNVKYTPTIILLSGNKVILKLEGTHSKEEISVPIMNMLATLSQP